MMISGALHSLKPATQLLWLVDVGAVTRQEACDAYMKQFGGAGKNGDLQVDMCYLRDVAETEASR